MRGIFGKARSARNPVRGTTQTSFLLRLARDTRGNVLAIMAAALIPFCGLVGGGIDLSRMYITKTRLQHACDAGALAGRKQMGSGTWGTDDNTAAIQYFNANFDSTGMYGSTAPTVAFTENAGKVTGTASATLPMTLMRVLGKTTETLPVTCDADMRLPNTDIMFVLDTTGSMGDTPLGDTVNKLASLKTSVKCFYEIVARLDTDANCTTGTPSGGTGNQVQVRFGFMPYATNVNVGKLLPASYFANTWQYQSRIGRWWVVTKSKVDPKPLTLTNVPQALCNDATAAAYGYNSYSDTIQGGAVPPYPTGTKRKVKRVDTRVTNWTNANGGTCFATQTTSDIDYELREGVTPTAADEWLDWRYGQITHNIAGLKNGTLWNSSFAVLNGTKGASTPITWDGCIEERPTVRATSYNPIPSDAYDLNIDLVPTIGNANSLWGPALRQLIYARDVQVTWAQLDLADTYTTADYSQNFAYSCPTEAKKMQAWPNADDFDDYIDSLTASGNTYHDIGLLWGARFVSPTGIFASENDFTPLGGEIDRNIIFMTDGDACTSNINYNAYGIAWFDRRQTPANTVPTDGCTETGTLTQQVNARTEALCAAIKNKNITLWVITFGYVDPRTVTRLTACATTSRYYSASNAAQLQSTFASIANQISQLRLTK